MIEFVSTNDTTNDTYMALTLEKCLEIEDSGN